MPHEVMSERVRDVGDGLILAFPITDTTVAGQTIRTVRLYFFRVGSQTRYFQRYQSLSSINSGSTTPTSGYDFLGDTGVGSGSDIFRIQNDDWHLMHFGVGPSHPDLQVFHAVNPNANGNPAQERDGENEDITPGTDDRGWYSMKQIDDKYDPPAFTERVSFRNDRDGEFLRWAFFNDGPNQLSGSDLDLFFTGRGYKVQPVTRQQVQNTMLDMALRRPDEPVIDTIMHQVGGINTYTFGSEEPDSWGDVDFTQDFNIENLSPGGGQAGGGRRARATQR